MCNLYGDSLKSLNAIMPTANHKRLEAEGQATMVKERNAFEELLQEQHRLNIRITLTRMLEKEVEAGAGTIRQGCMSTARELR